MEIFEINKLPRLLAQYDILARLDLNTLLSIFQCCKSFSELSNNNHFWKKHVMYRYVPLVDKFFRPKERDWKWVAKTQKSADLQGQNFSGCGTYMTDTNLFIGEFVDSKMDGYGRILKKTIENNVPKYIIIIEGLFKNGIPNGKVVKYYDKAVYEGEMFNGKIEGYGKMKWFDGHTYFGEWKDGKRDGEGTLVYPKGSKFVGTYVDNKKNGKGTHYYSTGEEFYSENWKNDKVSDFDYGTFKWTNGNTYTGQFIDESQICGFGEFIEKDGFKIKGEFIKEEKSKNGIPVDYPNCLNPIIIEVLKKQKCTKEVTNGNVYGQVLYSIHHTDRLFVCEPCLKTCRNNYFANKYFVGGSTCKCGSFDDIPCKMNQK